MDNFQDIGMDTNTDADMDTDIDMMLIRNLTWKWK